MTGPTEVGAAPAGAGQATSPASETEGLGVAAHRARLDDLLARLERVLAESGAHIDLVVFGGSALALSGFVGPRTYDLDLDVLGLLSGRELVTAVPLPKELAAAQKRLIVELGLSGDFIDPWMGRYMLGLGLPDGLVGRLESRSYGEALSIHVIGRLDMIHLKYLAVIESAPEFLEKHANDLRHLDPTPAELTPTVAWARSLLCRRIQRAQTLLQEQLLREGRRDQPLVKLLDVRFVPAPLRYRLGQWMMRRPAPCGRAYAHLIQRAGDIRRSRLAASRQ